jgi:colanic acid/amylovoran biosynthesis glycosyltransferase
MKGEPVKIAIVTNRFPSVSETFIALQIAELIKKGYFVKIVSLGLPKDSKPVDLSYAPEAFRKVSGKIKVYRTTFDSSDGFFLFIKHFFSVVFSAFFKHPLLFLKSCSLLLKGTNGIRKFKNLLYDSEVLKNVADCDLIHCQFADLADRVTYANKTGFFQSTAPIIFSVRGYDITKRSVVNTIDWQALAARCSQVMPVCNHFKTRLLKIGWDESKIHVVPSSVDIKNKTHFQHKNHSQLNVLKIISVGRLTEKKGFDDALDAVMLLNKHFTNFSYDIVGEGEQYATLKRKIKKYGLEHKVRLLGKMTTDKALELMSQCDILLAPSKTAADGDSEGIPNVIKEAMLLGLQVVATNHSGIPELVKNRETGMLVKEKSPIEIMEAIQELMSDKNLWEERSKEAAYFVSKEYSAESGLNKLLTVYEKSLNQSRFVSLTMYASKVG